MVSSIFTMFMGNLAALSQHSIKRILAYSSIAHAGYMLMGATTQTAAGIHGILFYVVSYCFMNLGAFWIASKVDDTLGGDHLKHFRGLVHRRPLYAVGMGVFLVSLIGMPPFAGFFGKFYLFSAVIAREMYGFALLAALNSVISLYYYAKILKAMFFDAAEVPMPAGKTGFDTKSSVVLVAFFAIPNVLLGFWAEPLMKIIHQATVFFTGP
jgi:NADH-quinone oxidoreductase subunit N